MSSLVRHILVCIALAAAVWGCKSGKKKPPMQTPETIAIPRPQENWNDQPLSVPAGPELPVKQGRAPIVYLVERQNMIRVVDMTSGDVLLRIPVTPRTIVAVDPNIGVRIGEATMKLGPLPADHEYGIYIESSETNISRRGVIRPGRPGTPAQPPAVTTQPTRVP